MAAIDPTEEAELGGSAEAKTTQSLSYWQLVRRRFFRNAS